MVSSSLPRITLSAFLLTVLLSVAWLPATPSTRAARTEAVSCQTGLTLILRPGPVPPADAAWNRPPARDIPPGPVIKRYPLYPGAIPSTVPMPPHAITGILPSYRKVASDEFDVSAGYPAVSAWYQHALASCGMLDDGTMPLQQHGGPRFAASTYSSSDGLSRLDLVFRPLSPTSTALLYFAQTLDLPPRPASSLLHGPFTRAAVDYRVTSALPGASRRYRFTITWPATIARLVAAINSPTRIWVPIGAGGMMISFQSARLSFVRRDGGARKVFVGGVLGQIIVGHSRPLVDPDWRVLKLVTRIRQRRCPAAGAC